MTASSRAMAFMSAMLAMGGPLPFGIRNRVENMIPHRPSKHRGNRTTRLAGRRSRCKTHLSRGSGSISARSDILQLCNQRKYLEAREMAEEHYIQCGESLFPGAWWRSDETPADNY